MKTSPRRPWFRYSLRTLFVVVTVLSIPLGWVSYQLNWIRQRRAVIRNAWWEQDREDLHAPGLLWMFGERGFSRVWLIEPATVEQVNDALRLFPEAETVATHPPPIVGATIEEVEKELFKQLDELQDRRNRGTRDTGEPRP